MSNFERLTERASCLERHSDKLVRAWQWNDGADIVFRITHGHRGWTAVCAFMVDDYPMASCDVNEGSEEDVMDAMTMRMLIDTKHEEVSNVTA